MAETVLSPVPDTASLRKSLKQFFGYTAFMGLQEEVIKNVLGGNDSFVIMPTGGVNRFATSFRLSCFPEPPS